MKWSEILLVKELTTVSLARTHSLTLLDRRLLQKCLKLNNN